VRRALVIGVLIAVTVGVVLTRQRAARDAQYRTLLGEGEQALAQKKSHAAVEAFSGALALRPDSMVAYYRRGEAYHQERQNEWAMRDWREAIRLAPQAPQPLVAMGDVHAERNEMALAAEWYDRAARLQPSDSRLLYNLALARYRSGSPAEAQAPLERAIDQDPAVAESHFLLGLVYRDVRELERATSALERAIRLAPGLTPAREELADLYRERGQHMDEMLQLQALADGDPRPARQVAIGLAEARRGQFDGALGTLAAATSGSPADPQVQLALGRVLILRGERQRDLASLTRAVTVLERALGGSARRSEGLALLGRALYLSGDAAGAERALREAVSTSPVALDAFAYLADAAALLRHPLIARDALVQLDALQGDTADHTTRLMRAHRIAVLSLDGGDGPTALRYLSQVLTARPPDAGTLGLVARARWQSGDPEGAKAALRKAIELDRDNVQLQQLLRTIR